MMGENIQQEFLKELKSKKKSIAMVGLGYVGLPLALELARYFKVVGFDISDERVAMMRRGEDPSDELPVEAFQGKDISYTTDPEALRECSFYIVAVPTDITEGKVPNLRPLQLASGTVAKTLEKGDYVIYESTVYPGCTEEVCIPILEEQTGLTSIEDFKFGYSPERINPGDKEHTVATILKIVSGCDAESAEVIDEVYKTVITAGTYRAESVKVAEAAKVIENTQRDLNISLMNELAMIFDRLGIDTEAVLKAAGTKWNFIPLRPGLVGGHCIGVDPYYLLHKAREVDIEPEVIAAGRRINDKMPAWIAKKVIVGLSRQGKSPSESRALVLGVTFKENVSDIRNSKVVELVRELEDYHVKVDVADPFADSSQLEHEYMLSLSEPEGPYDVILATVAHTEYLSMKRSEIEALGKPDLQIYDVKGMFTWGKDLNDRYWKL